MQHNMVLHVFPLMHHRAYIWELIDLYMDLEERPNSINVLHSEICAIFQVSRPTRLFDTVKRIVVPTKPEESVEASH